MMNADRTRTRRERTFVGSECAVCEEPLEHTLRGEKILQFSCSHVSHEACFYEFIREFESQNCPTCNAQLHLDTSRGGNVLDIGAYLHQSNSGVNAPANSSYLSGLEKISSMVRSVSVGDTNRAAPAASTTTPTTQTQATPWDDHTGRPPSRDSTGRNGSVQIVSRGSLRDQASDRFVGRNGHSRNDSDATGMTGVASSGGYPETTQSGPTRRHEYDLQAMEASLASPRGIARNPIPAPTVTVRSEFPTINRSRQQQTLTCLITVEVTDNKWRPDPDDLQAAPPLPQQRIEDQFPQRPPSPARSAPRFYPYEAPEVLEEMTETLRSRVDNWHGLDFSRYVDSIGNIVEFGS